MPDPSPLSPQVDVRMRGFRQRVPWESARDWVDAQIPSVEELPRDLTTLAEAAGRVLATSVVSTVDVPQFARAMMDGYALRADDIAGASDYNPLPLREIAVCVPGQAFDGRVGCGQAVRIMTGAPLPNGADAVLPFELSQSRPDGVFALAPVPPGKHVGRRGEDIAIGALVLPAGRRLRPQDVGVLSSIGRPNVETLRRPKVRILITGDELLPMGSRPEGYRIADANGPMLAALVARDGGQLAALEMLPDKQNVLASALLQEADVVLVSGGSSVGQEDHAPALVAQLGTLAIHGVAMRPSSPTGMGRIGDRIVFLLPGNPVSCLCAYDFFAGRAIRRLGGRPPEWPYRPVTATLTRKLVSQAGRLDYARVRCVDDQAEPLAISGASVLSSTTRADGFVVIQADSEGLPAGALTTVWLYDA